MIPIGQEDAPAWIPVVAFAIPALIVGAVLVPALRLRRRAREGRRAQQRRQPAAATELGSAASIDDPAPYTIDAILNALAVKPEDHGPTDDAPHDEGWAGSMLGLRSRISATTGVLEPHVYWGEREGRQVFVRMGPDEKIAGATTMFSNRHNRCITVVRVAAPIFDLVSDDGALSASPDSPAEIDDLVGALSRDRPTWSDVRIAGGPKGIVAARSAIDGTFGSWPYDLWLLERIARTLDLEPLAPARIGPQWKVPYGLGKSLKPEPR